MKLLEVKTVVDAVVAAKEDEGTGIDEIDGGGDRTTISPVIPVCMTHMIE